MILIARGLRGSRGVTSLVKFKVYFYLSRVEEQRRLWVFFKGKCSMQKALCMHEGGWSTCIREI